VRQVPDVRRAALASFIPFDRKDTLLVFSVDGEPEPPPAERRLAQYRVVSDGFFDTMGVALKRGRAFTAIRRGRGTPGRRREQRARREVLPAQGPDRPARHDGRSRRRAAQPGSPSSASSTMCDTGGLNEAPMPTLYYPVAQQTFPELTLVAKTGGDPLAITTTLRGIVRSLDPQIALADVRTMDDVVSASLAGARFRTTLLGIFAVVALLLSAVGVYGVMSYSVEQRTQELGLRMALGATGADVLRLVAGQGMRLAVAGILVGLVAAFWMVRVLESLLFGISATDPVTFGAIAVLLAVIAALASYIPARRATKADPMVVLRSE
jgi:putative ABC transport system permease protein